MTEPILSEEQQRLLAGYVLQDLSLEEAAAFEQLVKTNPAAVEELNQLQSCLEMAYAPSLVSPPEHLRATVLSNFQTASQSNSPSSQLAPPRPALRAVPQQQRRWLMGVGAIAAAVIVALGISNLWLWQKVQQQTVPAQIQPEVRTVVLEPVGDESIAMSQVTINSENLTGTLVVENLPPLSDDQVYVLWTVLASDAPYTTDEKNAILTKIFTTNKPEQLQQFPLPSVYQEDQWITAIAITVESASAPQQHQSAPILIKRL